MSSVIRFERPGPTKAIAELSPNGLVPLLDHNGAQRMGIPGDLRLLRGIPAIPVAR